MSQNAKEFCQALLTLEEKDRPNALQALQLPFLQQQQQQAEASTTAAPLTALYQSILVAAQTSTALDKLVAMNLVHYHPVIVPQDYQDAFSALATDCKGTISYTQLRNAAAAATLVEDEGAVMCYTEFLALALLGQGRLLDVKNQDLLQAAFYKLCNGSAVITKEHFVLLLGGDSSNMQLIFQSYDLDQDGVISWLDFSQAVCRERCLAAAVLRPDCHSLVSSSSSCWHHHHLPHPHAMCTDCETPHPVRV